MPETQRAPDFEHRPALGLASSFALGILAANNVSIDLRVWIAAAAAGTLFALIFREQKFATVLILAAFAAAGAASFGAEKAAITDDRLRTLYDNGSVRSGDPVEIEGVLTASPEPSHNGLFLNLRSEKLIHRGSERDVSGQVRLFLASNDQSSNDQIGVLDDQGLKYGSRIRVACKLEREDEYLNPGVITRREILDRIGVDVTGSVKSAMMIEHISDDSIFLPLAWVYSQRTRLIRDLRQNVDQPAAGIMIASLLGDKYFLDKHTADLFREGGTFHILVISGVHITFLGGLLLLFVSKFTRNRWLRFVIPTAILWAYTLAVGANLPVLRAAVMFTIIAFSFVIYRQRTLLNSLGVCAVLLLACRPAELFNPSFQLTFVSVSAIIAMAYPLIEMLRKIGAWMPTAQTPFPPDVPFWLQRFCEMLYWSEDLWAVEQNRQIWTTRLFKSPYWPRRLSATARSAMRFLFEGFLVSLVVQVWMLPLTVIYFHRVSVASILLNLWVGFFIAVESFAAIAGAMLFRISSFLAVPLFEFTEVLNWVMLSVPRLFADGSWTSFRLPAYSGMGRAIYLVYFIPVLLLAYLANRWSPFDLVRGTSLFRPRFVYSIMAVLVLTGGTIIFHPLSAPRPDGMLHIDFIDVGQGDSALVTFPDGKTMLVDGGGRFSYRESDETDTESFVPDIRPIGEAVVSEFLWDRGYSHIDLIMASHADVDHIQGLSDVAANFSIDSAIFGRTPMADPDFAKLATVLERRGIPIETATAGDRLVMGDVTIEILSPQYSADPDAISDNDQSVVLRIIYGDRAFLFTGDAELRTETDLVSATQPLNSDLIKVGHHGSRTSSSQPFVDAVGARYAVISVGRSSPFGHPHPEVVERWQAAGAKVLTTGEKGTISVSTNGSDLEIETFQP